MRIANNSLTINQIVDRFLDYYSNSELTKKQVKQVMYLFNKILSSWLIEKGYRYKLPHRLGYFEVAKTKMQYHLLKFDYGEWNKTGLKVYHENNHSDGWYARLHWEKKGSRVINKKWYYFKLVRANQRMIAKQMKENHKIYREWS